MSDDGSGDRPREAIPQERDVIRVEAEVQRDRAAVACELAEAARTRAAHTVRRSAVLRTRLLLQRDP